MLRSWHGLPAQMMSTGAISAPSIFVTSPSWIVSGKCFFVMLAGNGSISLLQSGFTLFLTAASCHPPIPSNKLPSVITFSHTPFSNFGLHRPWRPSDINLPVRHPSSGSCPLNSQSSAVLHYTAKGILRSAVKMGSHPGAASPVRKSARFPPGTCLAAPAAAPGFQTG